MAHRITIQKPFFRVRSITDMFAHSPPNNFGLGRPPDRTENKTLPSNPGNHTKYPIHPTLTLVKSEGGAPRPKVLSQKTREHRMITLPAIPRALLNEPMCQIQKTQTPEGFSPPPVNTTHFLGTLHYPHLSNFPQNGADWCGRLGFWLG